jgi:hypothetical protein
LEGRERVMRGGKRRGYILNKIYWQVNEHIHLLLEQNICCSQMEVDNGARGKKGEWERKGLGVKEREGRRGGRG